MDLIFDMSETLDETTETTPTEDVEDISTGNWHYCMI